MKKLKLKFNRKYFSYPYIAITVIFVVVPLIILLAYAFTTMKGNFTFDNFIKFFTSSSTAPIMLRSLWLAFLTSVICLVLAYPLALVLANSKFNKSKIIVLLFILPMWINFLLRTFAIKNLLAIIGIPNGFGAVLIGMVYDFFPFMLLPLYTILSNLDKSLIEAGNDLGANSLQTFLKVTLPLSVPGIVSGILMTFMPSISSFAVADMLGNKNTYLFGNKISDLFGMRNTWNLGSAFAFVMLLIIAASMAIASRFNKAGVKSGKGGSVL